MATYTWPKERRVLGTKVQRLDGPEKSTGRAKYSFDINRPGMLHAKILRCPFAHAKLKSVDTSVAENMPGFKVLHRIAKDGTELNYAGDEVLAIAADTEEHAADILRAIKAEYEPLDFFVKEEDALKDPEKKTLGGRGNVIVGNAATTGDAASAFAKADAVVEGTYGAHTISHQCLESHGLVAEWDKDGGLTVWCSTQATDATAGVLAQAFKIPKAKVKCITAYMGGGFGSKFGPDVQGIACAELAKKAQAPVKLMLDRAGEIVCAGNRPSVYGKVKMAGTKDGSITAYQVDCYGSPGVGNASAVNPYIAEPYVKDNIPNFLKKSTVVRLRPWQRSAPCGRLDTRRIASLPIARSTTWRPS